MASLSSHPPRDATAAGPARVLVVDDEEVMQDVLVRLFQGAGMTTTVCADGEAALERVATAEFDLMLLDLMLPGLDGLAVLGRLRERDVDVPVILITAHATVETAIEAMKRGAFDYVTKPFRNDELLLLSRRAIDGARLRRENRYLRRELARQHAGGPIVGRSEGMRRLLDQVRQVAPSRSTVLLEGESGTGKELMAQELHQASTRGDGPFVVVSCANLNPELQESTLFGHVAGVFPGAATAHKGMFERADGGSLFFDEVSALAMDVQAKLLRVIEDREFERLGSGQTTRVDVRIIAATNTDLREAVRSGRFREDLLYRLRVVSLRLPPLRERAGDVVLLADHFLRRYAGENRKEVQSISPEALARLEAHDWPGNVRELENVVQKAVLLSRGPTIGLDLVQDDVPGAGSRRRPVILGRDSHKDLVDAYERELILEALRLSQGVQKKAAELLSLKPTTLNEKIKRLRIRYRA